MPDEKPEYDVQSALVGAVGERATAHFHGLTPQDAVALVRQVVTELLPLITETLRAADPARLSETLARDVDGNVIVGSKAIVTPLQAEALAQAAPALPPDAPATTRHQLGAIAQALSEDLLPVADFACRAREYAARQRAARGPLAQAEREEPLYVPLELRFRRAIPDPADMLFHREERTFDDIRAAVAAPDPASPEGAPFPALVLLGAPGAGKSTSLRHLGLALLRAVLDDPAGHLPLFVSLGDHAEGAPLNFLAREWQRWYGDDLQAILDAGRLWLLADGLNEMPAENERDYEARVAAWRRFFKEAFPAGNRALVACRLADYGTGLELPRLEVEPMDDERIQDFISRRFQDAPERGRDLWRALLDDREVHGAEHSLYGLACNPFWLVMLADVYRDLERLPENRAALVQYFVERWLAYESDRPGGRPLGEAGRAALQLALDQLAFAMLGRGQNAPQPRAWALANLPEEVDVSGDRMRVEPRAALALAESACLLECRGRAEARVVRFYHQLLLEHFAGRELLRRFRAAPARGQTGFPPPLDEAALWRIPWQEKWQFVESAWDPLPPPPTSGWEEATVLAAASAALENGDWLRLARAVLPHNPPLAARCLLEAGRLPKAPLEARLQPGSPEAGRPEDGRPALAGCPAEAGRPIGGRPALAGFPEAGRPEDAARAEVTGRLLAVIHDPAATAALEPRQRLSLRIACGLALGHLGDPRILAGERWAIHPDGRCVRFILPRWSRVIPAGPFPMGSDRRDPEADGDEYSDATGGKPHTVVIPHAYAVGLYPVTNAEYECFIEDHGYEDERWWETDEARRWLRGELDLSGPWIARWRQLARWVREGRIDPDELLAQRRISPGYAETLKWAAAASDEELARAVQEAAGAAAEERGRPCFWDDRRYNNPSQPVVGVSWYEARAYCAWLTEQMRQANITWQIRDGRPEDGRPALAGFPAEAGRPEGEAGRPALAGFPAETGRPASGMGGPALAGIVRLPTEAEWEKAARWDGKKARRYPWGDDWDAALANTLEGRVLCTAPVGVYPEGAAPCGALDMAGNVWEWTSTRWGPEVEWPAFGYPYDSGDGREDPGGSDLRVVRGGSWNNECRNARCAYRDGLVTDIRVVNGGFRALLQLS